MTQTTPIVRGHTLIFQQDGQEQTLVVGTPAWYAWLGTATAFAFTNDCGAFTARKEQAGNKRGGSYWRAYRQRDGKLHRVYTYAVDLVGFVQPNAHDIGAGGGQHEWGDGKCRERVDVGRCELGEKSLDSLRITRGWGGVGPVESS